MICKCPKCGSYTNGEVSMLSYADIIGSQSSEELSSKGSVIAESLDKVANEKLGNIVGKSVGAVSKGIIKAASQTAGGYRYILHALPSITEYNEYYCFTCRNKSCLYRWVEKRTEAFDRTGDFYGECISSFNKCKGRRYLILNPDADIAYGINDNIFMLPYLPSGIIVPEDSNNKGEILVSHPVYPNVFYSLENYRIKVLEDELRDLKIFLQKLGASKIEISGMRDNELDRINTTSVNNRMSGAYDGINVNLDIEVNNEMHEYRRLRDEFKHGILSDIQQTPLLDLEKYERWVKYNPEWKSVLESRENCGTEYMISINSENITRAKKMELDRVSAAYSEFGIGSVNNDYAQKIISHVKESSKLYFKVYVKFYSLKEYNDPKIIEIKS